MEVHKRQWQGSWIPGAIIELWDRRVINGTEMILLSTINDLVHPTRGCYASNEYLADKVAATPDHVRRMLRKLQGLGLLFKTTEKNQRSMTTVWNRLIIEKPPEGGYEEGGRAFAPGGAGICAPQSITENINTVATAPEVPLARDIEEEPTVANVGFIPATPKETSGVPLPHHEGWAAALRQSMINKGRGVTRWSKRSWANEFRKLQSTDGVAADRIGVVLEWYGKHMGGQYVPQAWCAESFRKKFVAIEGAMQRHKDTTKVYAPTDETLAIYNEVRTEAWPNGSIKDLPRLVVESYDNYKAWYAKFRRLSLDKVPNASHSAIQRFAEHIKLEVGHPTKFIKWWVLEVQKKIANWDGWDGSLPPYVWRADHTMFAKAGAKWSKEWDGQTKWWPLLCDVINEMK